MKTVNYSRDKLVMRDSFWKRVTQDAFQDERIVIVTADMSAPGLDLFKRRFPKRYINVGIAEQQAILAACGLAKEGFIPFVYAIMPFITYRCYDQIKTIAGSMNIPINIVGVGSGLSYAGSGLVHHSLEDLAIMNMVPHLTTYNCSSGKMAEQVASHCIGAGRGLNYIRLDREPVQDPINDEHENLDFKKGFIELDEQKSEKVLITTGNMIHKFIPPNEPCSIHLIEMFKMPYQVGELLRTTRYAKKVYVVEENSASGGLGDLIRKTYSGTHVDVDTKGVEVKNAGYTYIYGGRDKIHQHYGLTRKDIDKWLGLDS